MTTTSARRPPSGKRSDTRSDGVAAPARPARQPTRPSKRPSKQPAKPVQPAKPARTAGPKDTVASGERTRPARAQSPQARRPAGGPPRAPFVLLIVGLLSGALVSLLLLNTVLAQDAFELTRLQQSTKQLEQERQALTLENAEEESPAQLGLKAKNLGMVQPTQPAFIDGPTGRVLGGSVRPVPHAAAAAAGAAGVVGVPGVVIPGDGVTAPVAPSPGAP